MKYVILVLVTLFNSICNAQQVYVVPNTGISLSAIGYRSGGNDPSSILTYPKFSNINPGMGADIVYKKGNFKHVFSFSSLPFGVSFVGNVKKEGTNQSSILFSNSSFQRQLGIGYQLFKEQNLSSTKSLRTLSLYYGGGLGIGFNRSKNFYAKNYINLNDGLVNGFDNHFYKYTYNGYREKTAIFIMPELGFTLHNKKDNPILNASFYYFLGLTPMTSFNLKLQYGKLNSSYFKEENQLLKTKGGVFGFKVGVPIKLFQFKKHGK